MSKNALKPFRILIIATALSGLLCINLFGCAAPEVTEATAKATIYDAGEDVEKPQINVPSTTPQPTFVEALEDPAVMSPTKQIQGTNFPDLNGSALILNPGQASRIASPLKPQVLLKVHPEGIVHIDLIGKGGILYARQLLDLHKQSGQEVLLQPELPFEIQKAEIPARLVVSLLDLGGRTVALTSTELTLLAGSVSVLNSDSNNNRGWIQIISPAENAAINGKNVHVIAQLYPANDEPIIAELVTADGAAINTRLVNLPKTPAGVKVDFVEINFFLPYAVSETTACRLTLSQSSYKGIEGALMLSSIPITISP